MHYNDNECTAASSPHSVELCTINVLLYLMNVDKNVKCFKIFPQRIAHKSRTEI